MLVIKKNLGFLDLQRLFVDFSHINIRSFAPDRDRWSSNPFTQEDGLNELYKPPKPPLLMLFIMQPLG
jgi:hypothetical protein